MSFTEARLWGHMELYWIAFYLFPEKHLNIRYKPNDSELLHIWDNIGKSCGWWWPYENICFIADRPVEINKNSLGQLHADGKPALLYADGYALWYLHGVKLPKEIVLISAEKLDPKIILQEKNAEVRREIVRKIGIERVVSKLNARVLDKMGDYELLQLPKLEGMQNTPIYLKMKNPSIGTYHVEGCPPNIKTCQEALTWRVGGQNWKPIILT